SEELQKAEELVRRLGEDAAFANGGNVEAEKVRAEFASSELSRRRFAIAEEIFQASDLVESTPELPYRDAVRRLLKATCILLDPLREIEERRLMHAVKACKEVLREIEPMSGDG